RHSGTSLRYAFHGKQPKLRRFVSDGDQLFVYRGIAIRLRLLETIERDDNHALRGWAIECYCPSPTNEETTARYPQHRRNCILVVFVPLWIRYLYFADKVDWRRLGWSHLCG